MGHRVQELMAAIHRHGGIRNLPDVPTGAFLPTFEPYGLAAALDGEITKARMNGFPRITIHLDLVDAQALADALKVR